MPVREEMGRHRPEPSLLRSRSLFIFHVAFAPRHRLDAVGTWSQEGIAAMDEVHDYIWGLEGAQRELVLSLHRMLTSEWGLNARIRYKIPFYDGKTWICYLSPVRGGRVELAFARGNELSNAQGILESKGRKQVYGLEFGSLAEVPMQALREVIQEAILLDQSQPYASKRKRS